MTTISTQCPKCDGEMVQGFTIYHSGAMEKVSIWVEGTPEKTSWMFQEGTKVPEDKCIPVGTMRCSACGFLESYARPEFAAQ